MANNLGFCTKCGSKNIVKNGHNGSGQQQYLCKDCKARRVLDSEKRYPEERKEEIIRAYLERSSLRGLERIFHVSRNTVSEWLKKIEKLPTIEQTLIEIEDDILELDEEWAFVKKKINKRWLWIALSRITRQVVAYFIGDRTIESCKKLEERIPEKYKNTFKFSDLWDAYNAVFPENHMSVDKSSGETCHVERFNCTIRQRLARYTRKTLAFSKSDFWHELVTHMFIINYNLSLKN